MILNESSTAYQLHCTRCTCHTQTCQGDWQFLRPEIGFTPKWYHQTLGVDSDLNFARTLFPNSRRALMYTPMVLANKPILEIPKDLEYVADNYGPCDIVAADIVAGTPDTKVRDLMKLCRDISDRYK